MTAAMCLVAHGLSVETPGGRPLVRDLNISMGREHVALVGRNGVGKSSLLRVLAGHEPPTSGRLNVSGSRLLVPQALGDDDHENHRSPGERRRAWLERARRARPDLLLLDEPTQDLDRDGIQWLFDWLQSWSGGLLVVSHDRRLLSCFENFFIVAESGCRYFGGNLSSLAEELQQQDQHAQAAYVRNLKRLVDQEAHDATVRQRRQRKKNVGRVRELGRCPSRALLNSKRSYAQQSQAKRALLQQNRLASMRSWAKATRRALSVNLPLRLAVPSLPPTTGPLALLENVSLSVPGRSLFQGVHLALERQRIRVVGPNGAGKSSLLEVLVGERSPTLGTARCDRARIGYIAQHAANWCLEESLLSKLLLDSTSGNLDQLSERLQAHQFPFSLAERPLASLSPGERVRAALICLFQRDPCPELLVLDEPTDQLDFVGTLALEKVLATWQGGLVIASHDEAFLTAVNANLPIELPLGTTDQ